MSEISKVFPIDLTVYPPQKTFSEVFNDSYDKTHKKSFLIKKAIIQFFKRIGYIIKL